MKKEDLEHIVNVNSINIGKNSANISVLLKFMYLVGAGIITQILLLVFGR